MSIPIETEYNTLRSEILNEMGMQTNLRIAMCTIAVTILSFAVDKESANLCLAVFGVLIPFKLLIHNKQAGILRISAYLIVKYESRYHSLSWESDIINLLKYRRIGSRMIYEIVSRIGYGVATILGILATYFYIKYLGPTKWYNYVPVLICLLITVALDFAFDLDKIREEYKKAFKMIMK